MSIHSSDDDRIVTQTEYYSSPMFKLRQTVWFPVLSTLVILAAFAAVIYYAYQKGTEEGVEPVVPVIVADNTPFKVKPEDPGGMEVPFRDSLVFDQIDDNKKEPEKEVETILPPPEEPVEKPAEVERVAEKPQIEEESGTEEEVVTDNQEAETIETLMAPEEPKPEAAEAAETVAEADVDTEEIKETMKQVLQTVEALEEEKKAAEKSLTAEVVDEEASTKSASAATDKPEAPSSDSLKSPPGFEEEEIPAQEMVAREQELMEAAERSKNKAITATTPVSKTGDYKIQLGAFRKTELADAAWIRWVKEYAPLLYGVDKKIVMADLGDKGIYYRVQGAGLSKERATEICSKIKEQGGACLVKKP